MVRARSYNLLCPISRALDHVGDRWSLLILRDLHAGPARFKDLQSGLTGIATNLLTDRLQALEASDLIQKTESDHGVSLYELTDQGARTGEVLFELAKLGSRLPRPETIKKPGNLRTIAVSLGTACKRAVRPEHAFEATLIVDGEAFRLTAGNGNSVIRAGGSGNPDLVLTTSYEPMMALADGHLDQSAFIKDHADLDVRTPGKEGQFFDLLSRAIKEFE